MPSGVSLDVRRTWVRLLCGASLLAGAILAPRIPALAQAAADSSPLVALASLLAVHHPAPGVVLGLALGVVAWARRRFFCRWVCPLGVFTGVADRCASHRGIRIARWPAVGMWMAAAALAGAVFGRPLLLWLDPVSLWVAAAGVGDGPAALAARAAMTGIIVIALSGLAIPGLWCSKLCPLGGFQDLLTLRTRRDDEPAPDRASALGWIRRDVLQLLAGATAATVGAHAAAAMATRRGLARGVGPIRPPGALPEAGYLSCCARCGNCVRACPASILEPDPAPASAAGLWAPRVRFARDYCRTDCNRCSVACPSGAIVPWRLSHKARIAFGLARVDMRGCLLADDRECDICGRVCPHDAVRFVWDAKTYSRRPSIDPERCTGCGACEVSCPGKVTEAAGAPAIAIASRRARLPAHRATPPAPASDAAPAG